MDLRDLGSRARRLRVLVDELNDVTRNHGDQRRTGIVSRELSMDPEDLVAEEAVVITLSEGDYVRRIPVEAFRTQNRGGTRASWPLHQGGGCPTTPSNMLLEGPVAHLHGCRAGLWIASVGGSTGVSSEPWNTDHQSPACDA